MTSDKVKALWAASARPAGTSQRDLPERLVANGQTRGYSLNLRSDDPSGNSPQEHKMNAENSVVVKQVQQGPQLAWAREDHTAWRQSHPIYQRVEDVTIHEDGSRDFLIRTEVPNDLGAKDVTYTNLEVTKGGRQ